MDTLAEGTRWVLKGDSSSPSILLLTMLDQGKPFPAFDRRTGEAIADSLVAVMNGKHRDPIQADGRTFRIARHELGASLKIEDGHDDICREAAFLFEEAADLAFKLSRTIRTFGDCYNNTNGSPQSCDFTVGLPVP
jgi:hypothetical protein